MAAQARRMIHLTDANADISEMKERLDATDAKLEAQDAKLDRILSLLGSR